MRAALKERVLKRAEKKKKLDDMYIHNYLAGHIVHHSSICGTSAEERTLQERSIFQNVETLEPPS